MAVGDVYVNGVHPTEKLTGQEICERIVVAGMWNGTPESLWNSRPDGELGGVFYMYWRAQAGEGGKIEMEIGNGRRIVMWEGER